MVVMAVLNQPKRRQTSLLRWYEKNKRDLPWRKNKNAYAIWVSEIMLQQTTVKTVIPHYEKFLVRYPTVKKLAGAQLESVLAAWSGLGYYRRARNLHKASIAIVRDHGSEFPNELDQIRSLPGIGIYTAAAVGSIAFGLEEPVLDGNVIRVLSRVLAYSMDTSLSQSRRFLHSEARKFLSHKKPGDSNQALMELGATVCLPRKALCTLCPLKPHCKAAKSNHPEKYPIVKPRPETSKETWLAKIFIRDGESKTQTRFLLKKTSPGHANEGLYEFPLSKIKNAVSNPSNKLVGSVRHTIMNRRMHIHVKCLRLERKLKPNERLVSSRNLDRIAVSGLTQKILKLWTKASHNKKTI